MNFYKFLKIESNFIPENAIEIILKNKLDFLSDATVKINDKQQVTNYRKTKWLNLDSDLFVNLQKTIFLIHEQHLTHLYNSQIDNIEGPQFLRYDVGDYYNAHNDSETFVDNKLKRVADRDISVLMYLNDDYEGGQIEFTQLQLTIRPKAGMLLAFPSYWEFEHKVHPVTKGTRYSIVSWIATKNRIYERPYCGLSTY